MLPISTQSLDNKVQTRSAHLTSSSGMCKPREKHLLGTTDRVVQRVRNLCLQSGFFKDAKGVKLTVQLSAYVKLILYL